MITDSFSFLVACIGFCIRYILYTRSKVATIPFLPFAPLSVPQNITRYLNSIKPDSCIELFKTGTNIVNQSENNVDWYIRSTGTEQKSNHIYYKLTHYKSICRYNWSVHNTKLEKNIKDLLVAWLTEENTFHVNNSYITNSAFLAHFGAKFGDGFYLVSWANIPLARFGQNFSKNGRSVTWYHKIHVSGH